MKSAGCMVLRTWLVAGLSAGLMAVALDCAMAEDANTGAAAGTNAVGAWQGTVSNATPGAPVALDDKQKGLVKTVDDYFNGLDAMQGHFLQTDAQSQQQKGDFYIKRPGRFRFVYAPPSKLVILSDGQTLSFEDYELKHADRYPLDTTPFRILLAKDVDILRDANVSNLSEAEDLLTLTLQDKSPDNPGAIQLLFVKKDGKIELKEWVITGPQGDNTRVEVADLARDKPIDDGLFKPAPLELQNAQKKN